MAERIDITLDDIAAALQYLDCCDVDVWLRAGMAMKREFGDVAFDIWDAWSQGFDRYKATETRMRWKNWKGSSARGTVSIGTVLHWAFDRGFKIEKPELTKEQKDAFIIEQQARRKVLAEQWAKEQADQLKWYDAIADVSERMMPLLKKVGNSPYLGKKKINSCGCYFPSEPFLLDFKDNFTVDIVTGRDAIQAVFNRKKANKAAGNDADSILHINRGTIVIPLFNEQCQLRNMQVIFKGNQKENSFTKLPLNHGQVSGCFNVIGSLDDDVDAPVAFVEGFATGASVHMATGWPVVVAFNSSNLPVVAGLPLYKNMNRKKIIAGDNDWEAALDPKKKNAGVVKAGQAAENCGGVLCVPEFVGDATGLSDFNDLHVTAGLDAVRVQLQAAVDRPVNFVFATGEKDALGLDAQDRRYEIVPPDYGDIPVGDYEDVLAANDSKTLPDDNSPAPTLTAAEITVEYYLRRYALTEPDAKVWDFDSHKLIKAGAFKNIIKPKIYTEWLNHPSRRTVALEDVEIDAAAAQKKGRGGLGEALRKYVYLNPSDTVWDKDRRELVPIAHLKIAIADCYAMWVTHPEREEIPARNFVFDPTQKVDVATHINQFRGLALSPVRDDKRCERIVRMLMALCNNDKIVFRWLRRWLAYPLINVGAKMETAVLCHSDVHGSGKSYFFDVVMRAIYGENSRTVGQAQLEGQYNDWMSKVLYCVYEEVLSRSQKYSHVGTIKQTITGKTVRIEKKFMSGWEEANHMNSVFLSNEVLPLPVEPSDRRFLVIWPETKLYEELQRGVNEDLKNGGAAAFYQFLLDTKMQNDDEDYPFDEHTKPPMTEAKERLIEHGRAIWEVFYNEWERGALEHNGMGVPYGTLRVADLFKYFSVWCKINNEHTCGSKTFSSFIGSKIKKRKDLNFNYKTFIGKATFFVIGECPKGKTQEEWLGACVEGHSEILNKVEYLYGDKAA